MRRREGNDVDFDVFANAGARGGFSPDTPGESSLGDSSATDLSGDAGHLRAHEAVAHRYSHMPASLTRLDLLADPDLPRFPGNLDSDDSNTDFSEGGDINNGVESTLAEATPMDALINSKSGKIDYRDFLESFQIVDVGWTNSVESSSLSREKRRRDSGYYNKK